MIGMIGPNRQHSPSSIELASVVALAATLFVGCGGFEGSEGQLEFDYESDPGFAEQRMGVDSKVRLAVSLAADGSDSEEDEDASEDERRRRRAEGSDEEEQVLRITDVESSDSSIISIDGVGDPEPSHVQLAAESAGAATIEVEAEDEQGETYTDNFRMRASEVAQLSIGDACSLGSEDGNTPVYLADQRVRLTYQLQDSEGEELAGWGYYPVSLSRTSDGSEIQPVEAADDLVVKIGTTADPLEVTSDLGDASLELDVRKASAIDGLRFPLEKDNGEPALLGGIEEGQKGILFASTKIGDRPVCQSRTALNASSQTSSVCSVATQTSSIEDEVGTLFNFTPTTVEVEKKSAGTCEFDLSVPASSNSVSRTMSFDLD